jgi:uncharacterized protein
MERDLNSPSRTDVVVWLRKTHGWIGLWGATLGLLFGFSGIWLNHRAVLKLEPAQSHDNLQVPLPDARPVDAQTMAAWLQATLSLPQPATNVRIEPARPVAWAERLAGQGQGGGHHGERHDDAGAGQGTNGAPGAREGDADRERSRDRETGARTTASAASAAPAASAATRMADAASAAPVQMQPEHWTINFAAPKSALQADYWVGNRTVSVRRTDNGFVAMLTNLHKGVGMPVAWILLVDTLAGSLILLSLSGLALWMLTRRKRTVGLAIFGTALAVTAGLAIAHL